MSGDDIEWYDDDDDTLCPCFVSKGKVAHNPGGCAGAPEIQTPLQTDNGSRKREPWVRLGNRPETGPDLEFLSLSLGERLGNARSLTNRIMKKIRVFGLRPNITSTFLNGVPMIV